MRTTTTKKNPKTKKNEGRTFPLQALVKAVVAKYPRDPSTPSVLLSLLSDGQFYVSIVRYKARFGEDKFVVCNARHANLVEALRELSRHWLGLGEAEIRVRRAVYPADAVPDSEECNFVRGMDDYGSLP